MSLLTSDKADFGTKNVNRNTEKHPIGMKGLIHPEDTTDEIHKAKLEQLKGQVSKSANVIGDGSAPLGTGGRWTEYRGGGAGSSAALPSKLPHETPSVLHPGVKECTLFSERFSNLVKPDTGEAAPLSSVEKGFNKSWEFIFNIQYSIIIFNKW